MYKPHKILPLTSLRFFAALYVVLYHTTGFVFPQLRDLATLDGRVLDLGYVAVSFFFTLSGYILAITYFTHPASPRGFWKARFARVYPLFFLTLLLDSPNYMASCVKDFGWHQAAIITLERLAQNALLLQAWVPQFRAMDGPNWSLSVEAFFYLLFPFLLRFVSRLRLAAIVGAGVAAYAAGLLVVFAAIHTHASPDVLKFNPLLHVSPFACGTLLGVSRFKRHVPSRTAPLLLITALLAFSIVICFQASIPLPFIHDGLLVPAFSCAILAFDSGFGKLDRLLSHKAIVLLGESSYALYLLHIPLWHIMFRLRLDRSAYAFWLYIVAAVGLSIVSFRYVEDPLRRAIKKAQISCIIHRWRTAKAKPAVEVLDHPAAWPSSTFATVDSALAAAGKTENPG